MRRNTIYIMSIWFLAILMGCSLDNNIEERSNLEDIDWQSIFIDSQSVYLIAGAPDGKLYATVGFNGLFYSEDKGSTWQKPDILNWEIIDMAFSPNGNIYATLNAPLDVGGVLRSTDGGMSWQSIQQPAGVPNALVIHPSGAILFGSSSLGYAFEGAVYKTEDDFTTCEKTGYPDTVAIYTMCINNDGDIFAGTAMGVYRSSDIGETWTAVNKGLVETDDTLHRTGIFDLELNPLNHQIFAIGYSALFKSKDSGENWSSTGLINPTTSHQIHDIIINTNGILFTYAWDWTPDVGIYYSIDNGDTWTKFSDEFSLPSVYSLTFDADGYFYAATAHGLYRTNKSTTE